MGGVGGREGEGGSGTKNTRTRKGERGGRGGRGGRECLIAIIDCIFEWDNPLRLPAPPPALLGLGQW